jgi:competence protein ComEC
MRWRFAALGGATAGLAASPALPRGLATAARPVLAAAVLGALALAAARPRNGGACASWVWLALIAGTAATAGGAGGVLRLAAIDREAFRAPAGTTLTARGFVTAVPRRSHGEVSVRVQTGAGRLLVEAREPVPDLPVGREVVAHGVLRAPDPWQAFYLRRYGIGEVLAADRVTLTDGSRGGIAAIADGIRDRSESALGRGTPEPAANLLRGFVLGEDDRNDAATTEDFQRSGLAHLLAVSGENVMLLALLAMPILAVLGVPLRARLACVLVLIAIYVPVTGAGPSIQRAGVMGAAGVVAALAGRPRSRWYAILLAAFATLALNPLSSADAGWQLSFAAVVGIMLWARGLADAITERLPGEPGALWRRALAEGAGVTIAASLATAPLMASTFGAVSLTTLPANLLALPAVAPVMWLGMLAAALGQIPGVPVEPITWLAGLLSAYIAEVAHLLGSPTWAQVQASPPGRAGLLVAYGLLGAGLSLCIAWSRRRGGLGLRTVRREQGRRPGRRALAVLAILASGLAIASLAAGSRGGGTHTDPGLRVTVLDVGQGDAILLQPANGGSVLVDGGPPDDGLREDLVEAGVSDLAAAVVTHYQSDHAGGIEDLIGSFPIHRLLYAERQPRLIAETRAAGVSATQVAEGSEVDSRDLRLEVLWPSRAELETAMRGEDPNRLCLVLVARWHGFDMLLTGDAEAESAPVDPGPIDVLKVAHHGSEDAGLDAFLDRTVPQLAVISVGADNPYGHPSPETLSTLAEHRVPALRTDTHGNVAIDVTRRGWAVEGG